MLLQVYTSELAKFSWEDDSQEVLVAGDGIEGIEYGADSRVTDPKALVGTGVPEADAVQEGSRWLFRADEPIVNFESNGKPGSCAFLVPADEDGTF